MNLSTLTDDALFGRVEALARTERFTMVDLLVHLAELDARPACQKKGWSSVFGYLTRQLGYSESDAMRRVRTARAARRFPSILRLIAKGELNLVGVSMIEPLLTPANHESLIRKACRRSTRDIERLVAELSPAAAEPRDRIRSLPAPDASVPAASVPAASIPAPLATAPPVASVDSTLPLTTVTNAPPPTESEAARGRRVVFTFTASEEVEGWYEQARDLLRHRFPAGAMEDIIGAALRRLVDDELAAHRTKRGNASPANTQSASRRIPKWVQDIVWRRDGGRCAYLGPNAQRCGETAWLELDHIVPWARGGRSDQPENIRLLCRAHNQSEAARLFGEAACRGST